MLRTILFALLIGGLAVNAPPAEAKSRKGAASHKKKKAKSRAKAAQRVEPESYSGDDNGATTVEAMALPAVGTAVKAPGAKVATPPAATPASPLGQKSLAAPAPGAQPWLEVSASMHMFNRDFTYRDDIFTALPTYRLGLGTAPALGVDVWPLDDIGAFAGYEHALGLSSQAPCPAGSSCTTLRFPTSSTAFQVGAQYRLPMNPYKFAARVGYGWRTFSISDAPGGVTKPQIPSVGYNFILARGSAQWTMLRFLALDASFGYRHLLSTGELGSASYFQRQTGAGIDASVGVSYLFHASSIYQPSSIRLSFDIERHFFSLNPEVGDALVAGGALDQFIGVRLSGSWAVF